MEKVPGGNRIYDLEDRLIKFSVMIIELCDSLPDDRASSHLGGQLIRSGTPPALNYGEAQAAESRKDFIHKMKVALKELRETSISLKILHARGTISTQYLGTLSECDELIAIFVKSISTAKSRSH